METLKQLECLRCGHKWWPRSTEKPRTCAACNSPYFDRPRKGVHKADAVSRKPIDKPIQ